MSPETAANRAKTRNQEKPTPKPYGINTRARYHDRNNACIPPDERRPYPPLRVFIDVRTSYQHTTVSPTHTATPTSSTTHNPFASPLSSSFYSTIPPSTTMQTLAFTNTSSVSAAKPHAGRSVSSRRSTVTPCPLRRCFRPTPSNDARKRRRRGKLPYLPASTPCSVPRGPIKATMQSLPGCRFGDELSRASNLLARLVRQAKCSDCTNDERPTAESHAFRFLARASAQSKGERRHCALAVDISLRR